MEVALNLYNFENNEAVGSRYVLTSPRSLEACSRMKVKPVELLHKPLSDFTNENCGKSVEFIQILYDDWEDKRVSLLKRCQKEREKIMMEQKVACSERRQQTKANSKKSNHSSSVDKFNGISGSPKSEVKHPKKYNKERLHHQTRSVFDTSCNPVITTVQPSRSISPVDMPITKDDSLLSCSFPRSRVPNKMFVNKVDGLRSKSVETENRRGKLVPSNISLRSLSVLGDNSTLPSGFTTPQIQRDKKLVQFMKLRRKQDEQEKKAGLEKTLAWSNERRRQDELKKREEIKRQKELAGQHLDWERRLKNEEIRRLARLKEIELERLREQEIAEAQAKSNIEKQEKLRLQQIESRKKLANERKMLQERALNVVHEEVLNFQQAIEEEIKAKQERAYQSKLENEMKELEKVKLMNKKQKDRLAEIQKEIKKKEEEREEMRKAALEGKLQRAAENYSKKLHSRELTIKQLSKQTNEKLKQSKKNVKQIEQENEDHFQSIIKHKNDKLRKAEGVASRNTENKSLRAKSIRISSEQGWKKKHHEIQERDLQHLQKIKENVELKEGKVQRHLQLKEAAFEFSRVQAQINEAEREIVKRKSSNFNEMAQKAKLIANVGRGPRSSFVNYSTVKFG